MVNKYSGGWGGVSEYSAEYGEGELSTASKRLVNIMLAWIHGCTQCMLQTYNTVALLNIDLMQIKFK